MFAATHQPRPPSTRSHRLPRPLFITLAAFYAFYCRRLQGSFFLYPSLASHAFLALLFAVASSSFFFFFALAPLFGSRHVILLVIHISVTSKKAKKTAKTTTKQDNAGDDEGERQRQRRRRRGRRDAVELLSGPCRGCYLYIRAASPLLAATAVALIHPI